MSRQLPCAVPQRRCAKAEEKCATTGAGIMRQGCHFVRAILAATLILSAGAGVDAAKLSNATTGRAAREDALRSIPFRSMTAEAQEKIAAVVRRPTMFRRMPVNQIECDEKLHQFLVRNPDVVVNIWQLMGITQVEVERTGPYTLNASDGVGTTTNIELIYGTSNFHLLYCEGSYSGPLTAGALKGRCVLLLKTRTLRRNGKPIVIDQLDVFVQVDNAGLDMLTRTLHPLLGRSADMNFIESTRFVERISHTAAANGTGMQLLAARLDNVSPEVQKEFAAISAEIHAKMKSQTQPQLAQRKPSPPANSQ